MKVRKFVEMLDHEMPIILNLMNHDNLLQQIPEPIVKETETKKSTSD